MSIPKKLESNYSESYQESISNRDGSSFLKKVGWTEKKNPNISQFELNYNQWDPEIISKNNKRRSSIDRRLKYQSFDSKNGINKRSVQNNSLFYSRKGEISFLNDIKTTVHQNPLKLNLNEGILILESNLSI